MAEGGGHDQRGIGIWWVLTAIADGNGLPRERVLDRLLVTPLATHQISSVTGILLTGLVTWLYFSPRPLASLRQAGDDR